MKDSPMTTLLIVGGVTLALLAAWLAARRALDRVDPELDFNDGWDWYDYSDDAAPEGLVAEVIDRGPGR